MSKSRNILGQITWIFGLWNSSQNNMDSWAINRVQKSKYSWPNNVIFWLRNHSQFVSFWRDKQPKYFGKLLFFLRLSLCSSFQPLFSRPKVEIFLAKQRQFVGFWRGKRPKYYGKLLSLLWLSLCSSFWPVFFVWVSN